MDQRIAKALQTASLLMLAWIVYVWLSKLHWMLSLVLFVFAILNIVTAWMIRECPTRLQAACRMGFLRKYVRFVCHWTGDQPPSSTECGKQTGLLLRSAQAFEAARERACQMVRGHDGTIDRMLLRINENLTLRRRQRSGAQEGPLASFLLIGADGVGKRHLTGVITRFLYGIGDVEIIDCDNTSVSLLTDRLIASVRQEPHRMLLFEHIDRAPTDVTGLISQLLSSGKLTDRSSGTTVTLEHTTIVFTTTSNEETLGAIHREVPSSAWQQVAIGLLVAESEISAKLLNGITELLYCDRPDDQVRCEVIALLMDQECSAHRTDLIHADPEIIATLALQVDDQRGFAMAPQLVKKLLRKPLIAATVADQQSVSLRVRCTSAFSAREC